MQTALTTIKQYCSKYDVITYTAEQLNDMREWLKECVHCGAFGDVESHEANSFIKGLSDVSVLRAIERHFDGGLNAFILSY